MECAVHELEFQIDTLFSGSIDEGEHIGQEQIVGTLKDGDRRQPSEVREHGADYWVGEFAYASPAASRPLKLLHGHECVDGFLLQGLRIGCP